MIHKSSSRNGNRQILALFLAQCGPVLLSGAMIASICLGVLQAQDTNDWFESKVRPIFVEHCYECHSGTKSKGGLLLDSKLGWSQGGQSGPAILPGDPDQSLLIQAVEYQTHQMPPKGKLTDLQIDTLIEWVQKGAPDPREAPILVGGMDAQTARNWWSFQPLPDPIDTFGSEWIDQQIDAKLLALGIVPCPTADARTLARRMSYDLTGLPPSPETLQDSLTTAPVSIAEDRFGQQIDSMLASSDYGVQWGRHWLDVVRYADTAGENTDRPVVNAWRYRNWVFDAMNRDMPFDAMVRHQIAGDQNTSDGIIATGYLAIARRFGHDIDKDMYLTYEEMIDNLGKSFLGLSIGCARCHDHKYDPISAKDYYALYGILASSKYSFPGCEPKGQPKDMVPLLSPSQIETLRKPWQEKADLAKQAKESQQASLGQARKYLSELDPTDRIAILQADVPEGAKVPFDSQGGANTIDVQPGEWIQLTVSPKGNHGADSTMVQLVIQAIGSDPNADNSVDDNTRVWSSDALVDNFSATSFQKLSPRTQAESKGVDHKGQDLRASWYYAESTKSPELLVELRTSNGGNANIRSWSVGELPSVFANVSDSPANVWTSLAAKSLFVHPGPERPVSLVWVSPIEGQVRVHGFVQDVHPAALDGVSFSVEHWKAPKAGEVFEQMAAILQTPILDPGPSPVIPEAYATVEGTIADARVHLRGDPEKPGDIVPRRWIEILGGDPLKDPKASGRIELADWIASHPLMARVMVNRVWQWHFGQGLVRTPNDFGSRGDQPSHPELLDQLAAQFVKSGYSIKQLHRWIMNTNAYRRSSSATAEQMLADPENRLLSHYPRRRLTAEEIRDSILACSGNLDRSYGQEHPFPAPATWTFSQHDPFNAVYATNRRSAMMMVQRQRRHPFLALFDGADPNASTPVRQTSSVPTQALYYLNDPFFHEQAAAIAKMLDTSKPASANVQSIYQRILQRPATDTQTQALLALVEGYEGAPIDAWAAAIRMLMASNEFHFID